MISIAYSVIGRIAITPDVRIGRARQNPVRTKVTASTGGIAGCAICIPSQMQELVIALMLTDHQICRLVITSDVIDVVNDSFRWERFAESVLRRKRMLIDEAATRPRPTDTDISMLI